MTPLPQAPDLGAFHRLGGLPSCGLRSSQIGCELLRAWPEPLPESLAVCTSPARFQGLAPRLGILPG